MKENGAAERLIIMMDHLIIYKSLRKNAMKSKSWRMRRIISATKSKAWRTNCSNKNNNLVSYTVQDKVM